MNKIFILITGTTASGKTEICKYFNKNLNFDYIEKDILINDFMKLKNIQDYKIVMDTKDFYDYCLDFVNQKILNNNNIIMSFMSPSKYFLDNINKLCDNKYLLFELFSLQFFKNSRNYYKDYDRKMIIHHITKQFNKDLDNRISYYI